MADPKFVYHKPTDEGTKRIIRFRFACATMYEAILKEVPEGREKSLAITKLEEVSMWGNKGIALTHGEPLL